MQSIHDRIIEKIFIQLKHLIYDKTLFTEGIP